MNTSPESPPYVEYLPLNLQPHGFTFGMLMSCVGGFLVLGSSIRHGKKLASLTFAGYLLGALGFLIYTGDIPGTWMWTQRAFEMPWIGLSITLLGVALMFAGSMIRYGRTHRLALVAIPLLHTWTGETNLDSC